MFEIFVIVKNVVLIMLLFGASIFIHELGHFLVAKKLGFKIKTFSIGFGKAIFSRTIDGVEWKIGWLPLGGYVALPQMDPTAGNRLEGVEGDEEGASTYIHPRKKIAVAVAGVIMNVIFAFCLSLIVWKVGIDIPSEKVNAYVGYVLDDSPASEQGMKPGDKILRTRSPGGTWTKIINFQRFMIEAALKKEIEVEFLSDGLTKHATFTTENTPFGRHIPFIAGIMACRVADFTPDSPAREGGLHKGDLILKFNEVTITDAGQFRKLLQAYGDKEISLVVKREGEEANVSFLPRDASAKELERNLGPFMIGVRWNGMVPSNPTPMEQMSEATFFVVRVLKALTTKEEVVQAGGSLSGPVGIVDALYRMLNIGFMQALSFIVLININLAILNMMPIPILDGGHVCFNLYEWIRGRPVHEKVIIVLSNVFLILFLTAFVFISYRDVRRTKALHDRMAEIEAADKKEKAADAIAVEAPVIQTPAPATP